MKTSNILITTFLATAMLTSPFAAGTAIADHHGGKMGTHFEKADMDGDGRISKEEHIKMATERFEKLDTDSDGYISKEEMKSKMSEWRDKVKEKKAEHKSKSHDAE
jgi:Ca2+-binding EF-hand superfamily protein